MGLKYIYRLLWKKKTLYSQTTELREYVQYNKTTKNKKINTLYTVANNKTVSKSVSLAHGCGKGATIDKSGFLNREFKKLKDEVL